MGGFVELDRALRILAEHAVDDTDVEMEVRVHHSSPISDSTIIATMAALS